ncbi:MAG: hypothetical protein ABI406_02570 [Ktedonobacteraceae bacterium]
MLLSSRTIVRSVLWLAVAMLIIVVFHIGDSTFVLRVGQFSPLTGAFIGGCLVLSSATSPRRRKEDTEPWIGNEQFGWILIGLGVMMWGIGESFWRYYISIGQSPFPSLADIGYSCFPLLMFGGLLLQPPSGTGRKRITLLLDSLIAMGSILAIAWYLLLGSLAQAPGEANLAKLLGIYYPIADTALLSCVIFLLLRGQGRAYQATARRTSLLVLGLGLCFFVFSDFLFNVQNNAGTYVEATWIDFGWPFGMMTIGVAAYLRRYLPATTPEVIEERMRQQVESSTFSPAQLLPYVLLAFLLFVLTLNIFATDPMQVAIRPVLLLATLSVVALVVIRQILTLRDNAMLARKQTETLEGLEHANKRIAEQSHAIARHNLELEYGIDHLKDVQANLANGNLRARARLDNGALLPLAASLNLMAERLTRLWQINAQAQRLSNGLRDLSIAIDKSWNGEPLTIPESCNNQVEISALLRSLHIKSSALPYKPVAQSAHAQTGQSGQSTQPTTGPLPPRQTSQSLLSEQATPLPPTHPMAMPHISPLAPATNSVRTGSGVTRLNSWKRE